jgi:hypothetical protein
MFKVAVSVLVYGSWLLLLRMAAPAVPVDIGAAATAMTTVATTAAGIRSERNPGFTNCILSVRRPR